MRKGTLLVARRLPSWLAWAGYGLITGLGLAYGLVPSVYLVSSLTVLALVLVYMVFLFYNAFADYYNTIQIMELEREQRLEQFLEQIDGTFQDDTCLTEEGNE